MADTTAWVTPTATPGQAGAGVIATTAAHLTAAGINPTTNVTRAAAYAQLMTQAMDFRRFLLAIDTQIDGDVQANITSLLALL